MGVPAGYYRRFAAELLDAGCDVTVVDLRGAGDSRPLIGRGSDHGYAQHLDDVAAVLRHLAPQLSGRRFVLAGHSLGGQLATLYLARQLHRREPLDIAVSGMVLLASGVPYHARFGLRSPYVRGFAATLQIASRIWGYWPGYGFGGPQPTRLIREWAHTIHRGEFASTDDVDLNPYLSELKLPVLGVSMESDQFTPAFATRQLTDRLSAAEVELRHYTAAEAGAKVDHFTWARASKPLATHIRDFLDRI